MQRRLFLEQVKNQGVAIAARAAAAAAAVPTTRFHNTNPALVTLARKLHRIKRQKLLEQASGNPQDATTMKNLHTRTHRSRPSLAYNSSVLRRY